jgi:hypothetical protein
MKDSSIYSIFISRKTSQPEQQPKVKPKPLVKNIDAREA